jgi:uncharacterized DUF497 family protein
MEYEWDPAKAKRNLAKHDISFTDAAEALEDPYKVEDPDPYEGEERNQVLCLHEENTVVLFVVTTEPEEDVCRIISARRALRHEQERYWKTRSLSP